MMTRQLLFGVILGLLAVVHSLPLVTASDILAQSKEGVLNEVKTEGFLVNELTSPSTTTESFKTNTTSQASQSSDSMVEGSGENPASEWFKGSTSAVPTQESSLTTEATPWPHLELTTEGSGENPASEWLVGSGHTPIGTSAFPTQESSLTTESGEVPETPLELTTEGTSEIISSSLFDGISETTAVSITSVLPEDPPSDPSTIQTTHSGLNAPPVQKIRKIGLLGSGPAPRTAIPDDSKINNSKSKAASKTHDRNDWLIIVGTAVGIVALLGFCVAVATRDKWNKNSSSSSDKKSNLMNQKREQELQTILHKNEPKENGQNGEYTVIPVNDIPEKYISN